MPNESDNVGAAEQPDNQTMILNPADVQQRIGAADAKAKAPVIAGTPRLVGKSDVVAGQTFDLTKAKTTVGRSEANDIVLKDGTVSARHAQLVQEGGTWRVINLISTNGTSVNGETNIVSYLSPGDTISFGRVEMIFEAEAAGDSKEVNGRLGGLSTAGGSGGINWGMWIGIGVAVAALAVAAYVLLTR